MTATMKRWAYVLCVRNHAGRLFVIGVGEVRALNRIFAEHDAIERHIPNDDKDWYETRILIEEMP